jgi:hypothetical protein
MGKSIEEGNLTAENIDFDEVVRAIREGSAPVSAAYEHGLNAIVLALRCFSGADLERISEMDREAARHALNEMKAGRDHLRRLAPDFDKYPAVARALDDAWRALFFAESYMTPFYMLANRDAVGAADPLSTYIVKNPESGLIKIGRTQNVEQRLRALRCGAGAELVLLASIPGDIEASLHKRFSQYSHHGEWFADVDGAIERYALTGGAE